MAAGHGVVAVNSALDENPRNDRRLDRGRVAGCRRARAGRWFGRGRATPAASAASTAAASVVTSDARSRTVGSPSPTGRRAAAAAAPAAGRLMIALYTPQMSAEPQGT